MGRLALAGFWQGVALALSLKAVHGLLGAALVVGLHAAHSRAGQPARAAARLLAVFGAAATAPLLGMGLVLQAHGGLRAVRGLLALAIGETVRFVDFSKDYGVSAVELGVAVLAAGGVALAWRQGGRAVIRDPLHGTLLVPALVVAAGLVWPWTPAVYRHAWLPVLPVMALYAGLAMAHLLARARGHPGRLVRLAVPLAVGAALAAPAVASIQEAVTPRSRESFAIMRRELALTCPGEPVLDGTALYVFRPAAYRYGALLNGVREWIARGVIPEEAIEADIRRAQPRVAYADRRLRSLVGPVADLLGRQYVSAGDGFLVAGATLAVPGGPRGGRAHVELLVGGPHRLTAGPGIAVAVDSRPVSPGWVSLAAGRHEVTWTGPAGTIQLVAATCPERRALDPAAPR
jgi:hypothetical protein